MLKKTLLTGAVAGFALGLASLTAPASAADWVKTGILTCNVSGGAGFVFGSDKAMSCTYSGTNGQIEHYAGNVEKFGVDLGYTRGGVLMWAVFAPTDHPPAHFLTGDYGGLTAGASVGVGGNANALIGGNGRAFQLQPLSIEGEKGLNVAAGIAEMKLRPMA